MALPSKKNKILTNTKPIKSGLQYMNEYGLNRIEELLYKTDKNTNFLPRSINMDDIDISFNNFIVNDRIEFTIRGKKVPVFYLENERWGEFSKTWQFTDDDKNVATPYITIRRYDKKTGTRLGVRWNIPQQKTFRYMDVPILDDGEIINLRFKIPQPINIDFFYELRLFTKYRIDVNNLDQAMFTNFSSRQDYIYPKNHPMPVILDSVDDNNSVVNIEGERLYSPIYRFKVMGYIQNEDDFQIVKTSRPTDVSYKLF